MIFFLSVVFSLDSGSGTVELESRPWFLGSESAWLVVVSWQSALSSRFGLLHGSESVCFMFGLFVFIYFTGIFFIL